jgi:hypothetical protein
MLNGCLLELALPNGKHFGDAFSNIGKLILLGKKLGCVLKIRALIPKKVCEQRKYWGV